MSSDLQSTKLESLITFSNGRSSPDRSDDRAFPVYGSNGLIGWANETNSPANSIVIGRVGSYCGSVHFSQSACWVTDNAIRATAKGDNDPYFLYYLLKHLDLNNWRSGSGQPLINQSTLNSIDVTVPASFSQRLIGSFISSLDDRITLLRETNATLEAIAQALFKSWFVDFDPVRAKAEGHQPEGMDVAAAALFPDSFEESELGSVPKGWEVLPLRQLCAFQKGCSYKGDGLADGEGAYMFNLGCFNKPRVYAFQKVKRYVGDYKPKHQVYPGDLIIANTDMTQQRDILGRPLLVPSGMEPGFISHHVFKVEVGERFGNQIRDFLFFSFQQAVFRERAVGYATGTTVLALPRDALEEHCVVLPSQSLLMAFSDVVSPLLSTIHENEERATLLTQLRDTLLPRLISGQLRLPQAAALIEEAV